MRVRNISIIAAESSLLEFNLSHELLSHFIVVEAPPLNIASLCEQYVPRINSKDAKDIVHHVSALQEFSRTIDDRAHATYFPKGPATAVNILNGVSRYQGKENPVKVWEYLSLKAHLQAFPEQPLIGKRTQAEIKNYSNLLLANNE